MSLTNDPVPVDWASKTRTQKMTWLGTQAAEPGSTVSLQECSVFGDRLSRYIHGAVEALKPIRKAGESDQKLKPLLSAFIMAFNSAMISLNSRVYSDGAKLVQNGTYTENDMVLIPTQTASDIVNAGVVTSPPAAYWANLSALLQTLINDFSRLKKPEPNGAAPFAQRIETVLSTGTDFFKEYLATIQT